MMCQRLGLPLHTKREAIVRNLIQPALRHLLAWSLALLSSLLPQYLPAQMDALITHYASQHAAD